MIEIRSLTSDTTDRPTALVNAIRALERLVYLSDDLPDSEVRTNVAIDDAGLTDMGDDA